VTVYVDSARIPAKVGRHSARWCHLMSDQIDPAELHAFAARIGLKRAWFQQGRIPVHDHYDVTEGMRRAAVAAGAVQVDIREMSELLQQKRQAWREMSS
jgi:hypothetical protein